MVVVVFGRLFTSADTSSQSKQTVLGYPFILTVFFSSRKDGKCYKHIRGDQFYCHKESELLNVRRFIDAMYDSFSDHKVDVRLKLTCLETGLQWSFDEMEGFNAFLKNNELAVEENNWSCRIM